MLDADDSIQSLQAAQHRMAVAGIPSYLETSRRGGHLWVFWERNIAPTIARALLQPYYAAKELEVFPSGDIPDAAGLGLLIRAPLGVHRLTMHRYGVVHPDLTPLVAGSRAAGQIEHLARYARKAVVPEYLQLALPPTPPPAVVHAAPERRSIASWLAEQDIRQVIGDYVELNRAGVGQCPWRDQHKYQDRHRSFQVYDSTQKWWCYTERIGGNTFDFLCRYFNLSPIDIPNPLLGLHHLRTLPTRDPRSCSSVSGLGRRVD